VLLAGQWATVITAVAFAAWALYVSLVEHPARLASPPTAAQAEFRQSYRRAAPYQASFAALSVIAGIMATAMSREGVWASAGVIVGLAIPFTVIVIAPTNRRLLGADLPADRVSALLVRWGRLHWIRSLLGVLGVAVLASRIRLG
jgi:Domain of unknown function (DUF1772)